MADEKKDFKAEKPKVLKEHEEVKNDAKDYFFYEKEPVIEEVVNRGDAREVTPKAYEITDKDMESLAKHAMRYLEKDLLEDDRTAAINSAVSMAIGTMDEGAWEGKVNASTSNLLVGMVDKKLNAAAEKKVRDQKDQNSAGMGTKEASENEEPVEAGESEKVKPAKPSKGVVVKLRGKTSPQVQTPSQTTKSLNKMPSRDRVNVKKLINRGDTVVLSSVVSNLDSIASFLEEGSNIELAKSLDMVANTLEKDAYQVEDLLKEKRQGESEIAKKFPWVAEALKEFEKEGASWNPTPFVSNLKENFFGNPEVQKAVTDLWEKEDRDRVGRLVNSILDTKKYYEDLMGILSKYKDMPLDNTSGEEG